MRSSTASVVMAALLVSAVPAAAWAEEIPDRAKRLAAQGRAAHESGDYDGAISAFTEANALAPAPPLLFNLAQAYRLKGDCDLASVMYRRFLATGPSADARAIAEEHLATVQRCARKIALSIPLDEKEKAAAPGAITKMEDPPAEPGVTQQRVGLGLMIGGGLALAAATYFTLDARAAENDVEQAYAEGRPGREIAPIDDRGERSQKLALVFGIGGSAIVAGGVVTYILGKRTERANAFAVVPTRQGAGVTYSWRF